MSRKDRREYYRQYYAANVERKREYARKRRQEHPGLYREKQVAVNKRAKIRARARGYKEPCVLEREQVIAAYWHAQGGCCYLCAEPLLLEEAILEHDHRCCPNRKWCSRCVRGAAHSSCNAAIGYVLDDPDRLETIARNLRAKLAEMDDRLAAKSQQLTLDDVA